MSKSCVENSVKNSIVAIVFKIVQILLPFITRTLVIKYLGLAYVGISGLFTSIFGLLGIAELGVGSAMLHALYVPIKKNETKRICAIINFYRKAYFAIGIVIFALGLMIMPFLKNFIKAGTYPENLNIYYIYLVNLTCTVISYLVYSYKSLLLEAHQLSRESNKVKIWMTFILFGLQAVILVTTRNYYAYITLSVFSTLASILWVAHVANRHFTDYKPAGTLEAEEKTGIIQDVKALFLYKIGGVVFNSVDAVVISWWFGAVILGIYNNYYYIVSSVSTMLLMIYSSVLPSLGISAAGTSKEKNYNNFMCAAFFDSWLNGWCSICLLCLLTPFINVWIGQNGLLNTSYAFLFAIYFFCWRILDPVSIYKDALGLWVMDRWRPFLTASLNLMLNIVLTMTIGLYGILLSSIISVLLISYPFSVKYLFKYFSKSSKEYYIQTAKVGLALIVFGAITFGICRWIDTGNPYVDMLIQLLICIILPNGLMILIFHKNPQIIRMKKQMMRWSVKNKS